jgi:hypothetical protein
METIVLFFVLTSNVIPAGRRRRARALISRRGHAARAPAGDDIFTAILPWDPVTAIDTGASAAFASACSIAPKTTAHGPGASVEVAP